MMCCAMRMCEDLEKPEDEQEEQQTLTCGAVRVYGDRNQG